VAKSTVAQRVLEKDLPSQLEEAKTSAARGSYGAALAALDRGLASFPEQQELLVLRAGVLSASGRIREALEGYQRAASLGAAQPELVSALGWLHLQMGRLPEAETWMRRWLAAEPGEIAARHGLCRTLMARQRIDEAMSLCEETLKHAPGDVESLALLAECKLRLNDQIAAEAHLRRALNIAPANTTLWINLSACLRNQHRTTEAIQALDEAQRIAIGLNDDSFVNIAVSRRILDQLDESLNICEQNLAERPNVDGHRVYAYALLCSGRLAEGWHHNEFRWLREPLLSLRRGAQGVPWRGQDLTGKSIVLHVEQGFGDAIQFVRYARHVKALGATVTLAVFPELARLASTCAGIDRVVNRNEPLPRGDYYCHLVSLPQIFCTTLDSIPADVPYLRGDPSEAAHWRERLQAPPGELRVGLVWAGNPKQARDRDRSVPVQSLVPLLAMPGVKFFSLQTSPGVQQLDELPSGLRPTNLAPELRDFADTAAAVNQLDLVITVDTAMAHLVGALGKPVWVLLHKDPDWRYLEERADSPWYPTMRLFRQRRDGDWTEVIERVIAALAMHLQRGQREEESQRSAVIVPALPAKSELLRLSRAHRRGLSAVVETRAGLVQFFPDEPTIGDSIDWYGEYLEGQVDLLTRLITPGATLIEVCPGVGMHALRLAAVAAPAGQVFLYEPRSLMRRLLRENLAANSIGNVTVMTNRLGGSADESQDWRAETIDDLRLAQLLMLKINDETMAREVLSGAAETLWRLRPFLFIATGSEAALHDLALQTKDYGYRCWKMETPLFNPNNFNLRTNDIFAASSAVALLAIPEESEQGMLTEGCTELS
jgi:tetratricopeptide (TPR) repeat protein